MIFNQVIGRRHFILYCMKGATLFPQAFHSVSTQQRLYNRINGGAVAVNIFRYLPGFS